jgi:hypothetical protein
MAERILGNGEVEGRSSMMPYGELLEPLIEAVKFVVELVDKHREISHKELTHWLDDYVKGSYDRLIEVDKDYRKQFARAASLLKQHADLKEAVDLLRAARPNQLLKRQEVRAYVKELARLQNSKKRKPKIVVQFFAYVNAVESYLNAASPLPPETWYSSFIDEFSRLVEQDRDPFSYDYPAVAQGKDAVRIAIDKLDEAVNRSMHEAMKDVLDAYMELRHACEESGVA